MPTRLLLVPVALGLMLAACATAALDPTPTPSVEPTATPTPTPVPTPTPAPRGVFADPIYLPDALVARVAEAVAAAPNELFLVPEAGRASVVVTYGQSAALPTLGQQVYALVAAFPTLVDDVPWSELLAAWNGGSARGPLRMAPSTYAALSARYGPSAPGAVELLPADQIVDALWADRNAWGIVPFDALTTYLKVLSIDGRTPVHRSLDLAQYPLVVDVVLAGDLSAASRLAEAFGAAHTNRDEERMSIVAMTGVTAMSRDFAAAMDQQGVLYPASLIRDYFTTSDVVHISNEVSFWEDCPPQPTQARTVFCSDPSYMQLLTDIGTDVIELTGNHLNDYGWEPLSHTLALYDQLGIPYFGGGRSPEEAARALLLEDHGNLLAFVGCNPVGPAIDWADGLGDGRPGSAPCSTPYETLRDEIGKAREAGATVFATLQYNEQPLGEYRYETADVQAYDFGLLADYGASVVSGSQGHSVQGFGLRGGSFLHYGVGNLFFDQMQGINLRQNFIDRYLVYDGRLLSVELLPTIRDEVALPRPLMPQEKSGLLQTLFALSNWDK